MLLLGLVILFALPIHRIWEGLLESRITQIPLIASSVASFEKWQMSWNNDARQTKSSPELLFQAQWFKPIEARWCT